MHAAELATLIVPPMYEAQMVNVYAIEVTARKMHQWDNLGKRIKSCRRKSSDNVSKLTFMDLVSLIDTRHHLEARGKT